MPRTTRRPRQRINYQTLSQFVQGNIDPAYKVDSTPKIESSTIKYVDYNSKTDNMYITFYSGGVYQYKDVPEILFKDFMNAESKGKFFHKNIRNIYRAKRVESWKRETSITPETETDYLQGYVDGIE